MDKLQCDICNADIELFYDTSRSVVEFNQLLLSMATNSPHGQKVISSGRVVILRDHVSMRTLESPGMMLIHMLAF